MILHEQILTWRQWKITILASDLSMTALETAQRGVYPIEKLDGIEERLIARYFKKTPEGYGIIDEIKRHIVFDHNLMHEGGYKDFDAVFCRNVLIYFDDETQKKVIDKFQRALVSRDTLSSGTPRPFREETTILFSYTRIKGQFIRRSNRRAIILLPELGSASIFY